MKHVRLFTLRCLGVPRRLAAAALLCLVLVSPLAAESLTWVAVYDNSQGMGKGPRNLVSILTPEAGFRCELLTPEEIAAGRLDSFDVIIMPGGSGSKQAATLGEAGCANIRKFVDAGGGYMGICAGSYLASSQYEWSLHLLNAKVFDREHWARGTGQVRLTVSDAGQSLLETGGADIEVYYGQGPLLVPDDKAGLPPYEMLATYASEIAEKGAPSGVMVGTTAIARAPYGAGRVICFSPHCEVTSGPRQMIIHGVNWAAGKAAVAAEPMLQPAAAAQQ